jgi:aromatic ring-opening dioxygenase catalytic subunit (LigB family)
MAKTTGRLPTYFISHGGGPWPWIKDLLPGDWSALESSLRSIPEQVGAVPRAVLAISGHWEEPEVTVQTHPNPPMFYDYGGFPDFTYRIQYPAPGAPDVAAEIGELLERAGIPHATDPDRGFDHGVFAPLFVMYPNADVPVLQLSLRKGYDPAEHLAIGRAIAPLRDEGVLIVGSGFTYHNLREFGPGGASASRVFSEWLDATLADAPISERSHRLLEWDRAPGARQSHPAEDHLIPLMVAVGAAEHDTGTRIYHEENVMDAGIHSSSYAFGL